LATENVVVTAPGEFKVPTVGDLETALPGAIKACQPFFAKPPVTQLTFTHTAASAKVSKKAAKAAKGSA
jgi:hypothetical protein